MKVTVLIVHSKSVKDQRACYIKEYFYLVPQETFKVVQGRHLLAKGRKMCCHFKIVLVVVHLQGHSLSIHTGFILNEVGPDQTGE